MRMRWHFINLLLEKFNLQSYLEIGYDRGECFSKVKTDCKTSVDPAKGRYSHATPTYRLTSDEYFQTVASKEGHKYDIIFIDGLHNNKQVSRDIENSINRINTGGFILLHDCNPPTEYHQREIHGGGEWNGTTWKAFVQFRKDNPDIMTFTIDADWGVGVIYVDKTFNGLIHKCGSSLSYEELEKNRAMLLNLKTITEFTELIETLTVLKEK